ncbi:MAG: hypothetical protein ABIN94_22750 [Ferruginibacter sp.]
MEDSAIECNKEIGNQQSSFVGRQWLDEMIFSENLPDGNRIIVVTGPPGIGKSAFMRNLAELHPRFLRYFIRRDSRELLKPGDAKSFLLAVGYQLASQYPELFTTQNIAISSNINVGTLHQQGEIVGVEIKELKVSPFYSVAINASQSIQSNRGKSTGVHIDLVDADIRGRTVDDLLETCLWEPLANLSNSLPEETCYILIDALDEIRFGSIEYTLVDLIINLRADIPANIKFIITSRPDFFLEPITSRKDCVVYKIDSASFENEKDLHTFIANQLKERFDSGKYMGVAAINDFSDALQRKAQGNFLYASSVLKSIHQLPGQNINQLNNFLEQLPADLHELYHFFIHRIIQLTVDSGFGKQAWRKYLAPILGILSVASEPLTESQLANFTRLSRNDIRDLLRNLQQFIETADDGTHHYRIYHTSFTEYLSSGTANHVDVLASHLLIAQFYKILITKRLIPSVDNYGLLYLAHHFSCTGVAQQKKIYELLSKEWMLEKRNRLGSHGSFALDIELVIEAAQTEIPANISVLLKAKTIMATLAGLYENLPMPLLRAALYAGQLQRVQGIISLITDEKKKFDAYFNLAECLYDYNNDTKNAVAALEVALNCAFRLLKKKQPFGFSILGSSELSETQRMEMVLHKFAAYKEFSLMFRCLQELEEYPYQYDDYVQTLIKLLIEHREIGIAEELCKKVSSKKIHTVTVSYLIVHFYNSGQIDKCHALFSDIHEIVKADKFIAKQVMENNAGFLCHHIPDMIITLMGVIDGSDKSSVVRTLIPICIADCEGLIEKLVNAFEKDYLQDECLLAVAQHFIEKNENARAIKWLRKMDNDAIDGNLKQVIGLYVAACAYDDALTIVLDRIKRWRNDNQLKEWLLGIHLSKGNVDASLEIIQSMSAQPEHAYLSQKGQALVTVITYLLATQSKLAVPEKLHSLTDKMMSMIQGLVYDREKIIIKIYFYSYYTKIGNMMKAEKLLQSIYDQIYKEHDEKIRNALKYRLLDQFKEQEDIAKMNELMVTMPDKLEKTSYLFKLVILQCKGGDTESAKISLNRFFSIFQQNNLQQDVNDQSTVFDSQYAERLLFDTIKYDLETLVRCKLIPDIDYLNDLLGNTQLKDTIIAQIAIIQMNASDFSAVETILQNILYKDTKLEILCLLTIKYVDEKQISFAYTALDRAFNELEMLPFEGLVLKKSDLLISLFECNSNRKIFEWIKEFIENKRLEIFNFEQILLIAQYIKGREKNKGVRRLLEQMEEQVQLLPAKVDESDWDKLNLPAILAVCGNHQAAFKILNKITNEGELQTAFENILNTSIPITKILSWGRLIEEHQRACFQQSIASCAGNFVLDGKWQMAMQLFDYIKNQTDFNGKLKEFMYRQNNTAFTIFKPLNHLSKSFDKNMSFVDALWPDKTTPLPVLYLQSFVTHLIRRKVCICEEAALGWVKAAAKNIKEPYYKVIYCCEMSRLHTVAGSNDEAAQMIKEADIIANEASANYFHIDILYEIALAHFFNGNTMLGKERLEKITLIEKVENEDSQQADTANTFSIFPIKIVDPIEKNNDNESEDSPDAPHFLPLEYEIQKDSSSLKFMPPRAFKLHFFSIDRYLKLTKELVMLDMIPRAIGLANSLRDNSARNDVLKIIVTAVFQRQQFKEGYELFSRIWEEEADTFNILWRKKAVDMSTKKKIFLAECFANSGYEKQAFDLLDEIPDNYTEEVMEIKNKIIKLLEIQPIDKVVRFAQFANLIKGLSLKRQSSIEFLNEYSHTVAELDNGQSLLNMVQDFEAIITWWD